VRVAFYCDVNSRGGVWAYTVSLSEHLRKLGAHVHVITHSPSRPENKAISDTLLAAADTNEVLPVDRPDSTDVANLSNALINSNAQVYVPNYRQNPFAALVCVRSQINLQGLGICHNNNDAAYGVLTRYAGVLSRFVCASQTTLAELGSRLPERKSDMACIPHGVRTPAQSCTPFRGGPIKLIYHGRLCEEQKRISRLLDVADALVKRDVPFSLELIGEGADVAAYRKRVDDGPLRAFVTLTPSMEWRDLLPKLLDAHVAVLTSEYEGFCFSLAEAMGCGLPGAAFYTGGVVEEYLNDGRNGFVLKQGDIEGLADAVARVQKDPALWLSMSQAARATITGRYSWDTSARSYLAVLEETVRSPRRASWPTLRPAWIPPDRRTWRSVVESLGTRAGAWR
jgi:glycosyltransferase involved in cell wall biosynthesis